MSSVAGPVVGVWLVVSHGMDRICDFSSDVVVDRCSGMYVTLFGAHRLPQFMQTSNADAWLVAVGAAFGIVLADVIVLGAMWLWSRLGRNRSTEAPQELAQP